MNKEIKTSVPNDNEIVLGILNGSNDILGRIYKAYFPMILQLIVTNNGDEDDAKDIFQETVIVLYDKVQAGNFELSSKLKTFIYSVSRRLWLKKLNYKSRNTGSVEDFENVVSVEQDMEEHEEKDRMFTQMESALQLLGEPCRTIIEDFYIKSKSMQEICEKFGYTNADNAKNQKYKCLQRLKKMFFLESKK